MVINIALAKKRIGEFAPVQKIFLSAASLVIFLWLVLTLFVLSKSAVDFLSEYQADKFLHFIGGTFAAAVSYALFGLTRSKPVAGSVLVIGILWEIFELVFLPDQLFRFRREFLLWSSDTFFDLVVDVLGAYFWVNFVIYSSNGVGHAPPANGE